MTFSVIIPIYNVEKYIERCINSVLSQSYTDFELILVNDGSSDKSPEICDRYAVNDCRIRVIHKGNGGLSDARNAGIRAAVGKYILFVDGDDFWHTSQALEKIAIILEETGSTIVQFGHEIYLHNEDKIVKGPTRFFSKNNGDSFEEIVYNLVATGKLAISACSMAISRKFILENNLLFKEGLRTEDLEWAIRVFACEPKFSFSDEYFYAYRKQHGGTITSRIDYFHLCDYCWILEKSIIVVEECKGKKRDALMSYLMYHILIASALCYRINLETSQRREILLRLESSCEKRITKYTLNKKVKVASLIYRICGFTTMSKILGAYLNHRGR